MDPAITNWLRTARYDLETARDLLAAGRTLYVLFACHAAVEKTLKARVLQSTLQPPPRTHDLWHLVRLADLEVPDRFADGITYLARGFIEVRYPMDLDAAEAKYPPSAVQPVVTMTEEIVRWIESTLQR